MKLKKKQRREIIRIAEYMVSGGAFFWSGYLALIVFKAGFGFSLWWATSLSYLIGWTVNYLLQRYWVFNNPRLAKHELEVTGRYLTISAVNLFINYAILWSLESVGITVYIGQFISAEFFTVWNYLWYKFWVFPEKFSRRHSSLAKSKAKRASSVRRNGRYRNSRTRRVHVRAAVSPKPAAINERASKNALKFILTPAHRHKSRTWKGRKK
jgi:putative flippase GtrA